MTKQLLPYLLTVFMSMFGQKAFAYDIAVKNADGVTIYYNWNDDKTELAVTSLYGYQYGGGYSGIVVIPESVEYNGKIYKVTQIGYSAFKRCSVTSVIIPNSVTSIGGEAFFDCDMGSISIPSSVKYIGDEAFYRSSLTSVIISDLSSWCNVSFHPSYGNPLVFAENLILNDKKVTNLIIPDGVTYISNRAFGGYKGLTSVTIPNSVTSIEDYAFAGCSGLAYVTIPNSVTSVGGGAFNGTAWLDNQPNGLVYAGKVAYKYKGEMPANTRISIQNGTSLIADDAFYGCSGLTSITIPNSVTSIGKESFSGCSGLTSITIPNSVISIGDGAFSGCSGLLFIAIPNRMTSISSSAFRNCSSLASVTIPNSVASIGSSAFADCSSLASVTIPNSVTTIDYSAFAGCSSLTSVTIPNSVTTIGGEVFRSCTDLESIKVESGNLKYDSRNDCNAIIETSSNLIIIGCKNTIIPNSVTSIGSSAFKNCSGLTSIIIPNSVTSIGVDAFMGCSGLISVTFPNSDISITDGAFDGTAWYDSQPDGLVYAGMVAYKYKGTMPDNTHVTIKDGTLGISQSVFYNCSGLTSVTIPNSVTSIGSSAFEGCKGLTSVTIPNSVISIGEFAFAYCSGLASVAIPNSVTSISRYAFYWCSGLTSVTIPNSVTSIGSSAFSSCYRLTSVTIPNSVTSIDTYAFNGCKGLTIITSEIEKPYEIDSYTFDSDTYNVAELIVPYGTKAVYQNTEGWNKFTMITEAPDKDAVAFTIDGIAYEGRKSEKTVVVKSVDTKPTSIEIPASVSYDGITYLVSGITDGVFDGSNMAALIWDVEAALPNNAFSNASIGSNFLLYVKSSSYAPSSIKNVVVDGTAQTIVLSDDGGQFYCPQAFTARRISYSHNYSMETGKGSTMGWESIALPFDVQRIIHSTQGEIVPFAAYSSGSNQKPFWLAYMSAGGFKRTADIRANEAYIIAMPNNSSYQDNYILAGDVTFSAENITVPKTPTFNGTFLPAFSFVAKSSSVYALNVNNRYVRYSGSEKPGSIFIRDLRDVCPFEAYLTGNFTRGIIEINYDNGTTDILDVLLSTDDSQEMTIHTLNGQQVTRTTQRDFDTVWQQLPKGVYIVNGKKMIK